MAFIAVGVVVKSTNKEKFPIGSLYASILSRRPAMRKPWPSLLIDEQTNTLIGVTVKWLILEKVSMKWVKDREMYEELVKPRIKELFKIAEQKLKEMKETKKQEWNRMRYKPLTEWIRA